MPGAVAAIIPAAGIGSRLGSAAEGVSAPKALRVLAGRTLLQRCIDALSPYVDQIVVAAPPDGLAALPESGVPVQVVAGGATRQQSVRQALAVLDDRFTWVLVHDAARPLVSGDVVRRVFAALEDGARCVVPTIPAHDSLRWQADDGTNAPLERSRVRLVQTPQGFTLDALRRAHRGSTTDQATDDAGLVEALGEAVTLVEGDPRAFKITGPLDLLLAQALLAGS